MDFYHFAPIFGAMVGVELHQKFGAKWGKVVQWLEISLENFIKILKSNFIFETRDFQKILIQYTRFLRNFLKVYIEYTILILNFDYFCFIFAKGCAVLMHWIWMRLDPLWMLPFISTKPTSYCKI